MKENVKICFVCHNNLQTLDYKINHEVNLFVCGKCRDSEEEKAKVKELLDSLANGFVCGCI